LPCKNQQGTIEEMEIIFMGGNSKKNSKVELVDLKGIRKRIKKIKKRESKIYK
jgi:hypothetical protein